MTITAIFNNLFKSDFFYSSFQPKSLTNSINKQLDLKSNQKQELFFRLNDTKTRIYIVENAFNHEVKFDQIDAHIHEINELKLQYSSLLKQAKTMNISNKYTCKEEI